MSGALPAFDPSLYQPPFPESMPDNFSSQALAASIVIGVGQCRLIGITGYSNKAAAQFIQVFDSNVLPADGAVPQIVFAVGAGAGAASGTFSLYFGASGRWFDRGITICNSSTLATKTIGSANCWFDVQYVPQVL